MKLRSCVIGALALAAIGVPAAQADTIQGVYLFPDLGTVLENDGTQGTPFSFSMLGGYFTLSSADNVVTLTIDQAFAFNSAAFNGPELIDLTSANLLNVVLDPSTTIPGFDQSRISFDASHIWLNMQDLGFNSDGQYVGLVPGQIAVLDITSSDDGNGSTGSVPEPFTLSIFGAGLAGSAMLRRRGKSRA